MAADYYVNNVTSTVQMMDSEMLLSPELARRITAMVLDEMDRKQAFEQRSESDRRIDQGAQRNNRDSAGRWA
jgi:hypothetical protein